MVNLTKGGMLALPDSAAETDDASAFLLPFTV